MLRAGSLPLLVLLSALAAPSALAPQRGVDEQTHQLTVTAELSLIELGVLVDGEVQPVPEGLEVSREETTTVVVHDDFVDVPEAPGRKRRVLTFERARLEVERTLGAGLQGEGEASQVLPSPFEGRQVVVEPGGTEKRWGGEDAADVPTVLLDGVQAPTDFPLLWEGRMEGLVTHLQAEAFEELRTPFGVLAFGSALDRAPAATEDRWSGEMTIVQAETQPPRSVPTAPERPDRVIDYVLEFDVLRVSDRTESQRATQGEDSPFELLLASSETRWEGKGSLRWNVSKKRLEYAKLAAEVEIEDRTDLRAGGSTREQVQRMGGPWTLEYAVR